MAQLIFPILLLIGIVSISKCQSNDLKDECSRICTELGTQSMYERGGYSASKCYCKRDGEWKIEKVF